MDNLPRSKLKTVPLIAVMALLLQGCWLFNSQYGVRVKQIAADLTFGIPPIEEVTGPANLDTEQAGSKPVTVQRGNTRNRGGAPVFRGAPACPAAGPTDFPEEPAPARIEDDNRPQIGQYLWLVNGTRFIPGSGEIPFETFSHHKVVTVRSQSSAQNATTPVVFEFQIVEKDYGTGSERDVMTTYQVRADGLYLLRVTTLRAGQTTGEFEPTPSILMLPLPVSPGAAVNTTGVDANSQKALAQNGSVVGRDRVDVCGKVIDVWRVETERSFTTDGGPPTSGGRRTITSRYTYTIATGFGGLIASEHHEVDHSDPEVTVPALVIKARLGQHEPDPLEEG